MLIQLVQHLPIELLFIKKENMKYKQLNSTYLYDTLAEAMYARELEYFHYEFDLNNFIEIMKHTDEQSKPQLQERIDETERQMRNVECIYNALEKQILDQDEYQAAVERATLRRLNA